MHHFGVLCHRFQLFLYCLKAVVALLIAGIDNIIFYCYITILAGITAVIASISGYMASFLSVMALFSVFILKKRTQHIIIKIS